MNPEVQGQGLGITELIGVLVTEGVQPLTRLSAQVGHEVHAAV